MHYLIFKNDIVVCKTVKNNLPNAKQSNINEHDARLLNGIVVNGNNYNTFYIDEIGIKHIIQLNDTWQKIKCNFNDFFGMIFNDIIY